MMNKDVSAENPKIPNGASTQKAASPLSCAALLAVRMLATLQLALIAMYEHSWEYQRGFPGGGRAWLVLLLGGGLLAILWLPRGLKAARLAVVICVTLFCGWILGFAVAMDMLPLYDHMGGGETAFYAVKTCPMGAAIGAVGVGMFVDHRWPLVAKPEVPPAEPLEGAGVLPAAHVSLFLAVAGWVCFGLAFPARSMALFVFAVIGHAVAILLGDRARKAIKRQPQMRGRGIAVAGMILGGLFLAGLAGSVFVTVVWALFFRAF